MRHVLIMLALAAAPAIAFAQGASISETNAVARIAECLAQGAPGDWQRLTMVVELEKPGDATGGVRYFATDASGKAEPYTPCDTRKPALMLLEARKSQTPERKGWISARLVLFEDGKFELHYDYPK
jgi:hypothetical protein